MGKKFQKSIEIFEFARIDYFIENPEIPLRNWKLMHLGTVNLAANQIQKVEGIVDTFENSGNKIKLMRTLMREGLSTFDADSFFMSLSSNLRSGI